MARIVAPHPAIRRLLPRPARSKFPFGPRGTGKSTCAQRVSPDALFVEDGADWRATHITSQLPVGHWHDLVGNPTPDETFVASSWLP